jgi:carbamoyl-phosphate synthase large subunit
MSLRLLLVSGTSVVGQNVLAALEGRRAGITVAATGSVAFDLAAFDFDSVYLLPETASDPDGFEDRLAAVIEHERADLVVPCRDDDVVAIARLGARRPHLAPVLLCGTPETALTIHDKWLSAMFAAQHGLPFVPSAPTGAAVDLSEFARAHGFPLVVKPRLGFGSRGVRIIADVGQLERAALCPGLVVQPFLGDTRVVSEWAAQLDDLGIPLFHSFEGVKRAGQILIGPDGTASGLQCTRNTMRDGFSVRVALDEDETMRDITVGCARAFAAEGWRGPFNVQCLSAYDGQLLIHEFNGRLTGATAAQLLMGQDDVRLAIERFTGRMIAAVEPPSGGWPREIVKMPRSLAADLARLKAVMHTGMWAKDAEPS